MANKEKTKEVAKQPEAKSETKKAEKVVEKKLVTVVAVITDVYSNFQLTIEDGTQQVMAKFKEIGQTHNVRGKEIIPSKVSSLTRAFMRDIKVKRKGKWEKLELIEDEKLGLKIKVKV